MKKQLIVLHIDHTHGTYMLPFQSEADLRDWQLTEAKENWDDHFDEPMPEDEDELVEQYREQIGSYCGDGEYWQWDTFEVDVPEVVELVALAASVAAQDPITYSDDTPDPYRQLAAIVNSYQEKARAVLTKIKGEQP
jgi:hypothetical protein